MYQKTSKRVSNALREPLHPRAQKDGRQDLLADLIQLHKTRPEFKDSYLRRLAVTNFGAGHETMCSALTSAMAMIGCHPDVHRKVAQEVRRPAEPTTSSDAVRPRYAQASIKEAQRLHPVIGMSIPRKVPAGGLSLHGYFFPPGITVGCNPAALHRNCDVFGMDADRYNPGRWLGDDVQATRMMERINLTWGNGGRTCPGRHLAELVIHKTIPALLREFNLEITAMPDESEMPRYFMAMLSGVKARFRSVGENMKP